MAALSPSELVTLLEREMPEVLVAAAPLQITNQPAHGPQKAPFSPADAQIAPQAIVTVACYLRDRLGYSLLSDIAVVDYLIDGVFELVYRFYHPNGGAALLLRTRIPREDPRLPALTPQWPGADFHEREAFDLFGVLFEGHPNLRRIYMWDEFEGFPMRRDFPRQGDKYLGDDE